DVAFQNPVGTTGLSTVWPTKDLVTLVQGIRTAPLQSKAVGMAIGQAFRDGIETGLVQRLHRSIGHRGKPERPLFAVALGNVYSAERFRPIAVPTQSTESSRLGLWRVPEDSVYARGLRT